MTTRFSVGHNAVNLIRNGGLDFLKDTASMPPFWSVEGADFLAVPPANTLSIVSGETPDSEFGAVNYFKILLASSTPVVLSQEFEDRFIQMAFVEEMGEDFHDHDNRYRYSVPGCQLVTGWVSIGASFRVVRGSVSIAVRFYNDRNRAIYTDDGLYQSLSTKEWGRPAIVKNLGGAMLRSAGFVLTSAVPGLSEIHVGAMMMASGKFSDLPYTGDPMADAIPKGAIVFAFGDACPPGFEKMSLASPPSGRVFFKQGTPSLAVEGDERHKHSGAEMAMNPEDDWGILSLFPTPFGQQYGRYADDGSASHKHDLGLAKHVPPSRDVILCKRL